MTDTHNISNNAEMLTHLLLHSAHYMDWKSVSAPLSKLVTRDRSCVGRNARRPARFDSDTEGDDTEYESN